MNNSDRDPGFSKEAERAKSAFFGTLIGAVLGLAIIATAIFLLMTTG